MTPATVAALIAACCYLTAASTPLQAALDAAIASGANVFELQAIVYPQNDAPLVVRAHNFTIRGNGATILFAPGAGVLVDASTDVLLMDVTVAYDPPCFTQGAVVAWSATSATVDVRLDPGFPLPNATYFTTVEIKLQFFDAAPPNLRTLGQSGAMIVTVVGEVAPGVWRVQRAPGFPFTVPPGNLLATISPRVNAPGYQIPQGYVGGAWWVFNSTRVTTQGVSVLGSGNFAFTEWGGGGGHVYLNTVLGRAQGHLLASNTDGFHSFSVGVGPTIINASWAFMGDDVANIHNRVCLVLALAGPNVAIIDVGDMPTPALDPANPARAFADIVPGDTLKLSSPQGAPRGGGTGAFAVTAIQWSTNATLIAAARAFIAGRPGVAINPAGVGVWEVVFSADAGVAGVVIGDVVQFDRRAGVGASIVNSTFTDAYDSCFRLQASGAIVANNSWNRIPGGVSIVYDPDWLEGSSDIRDVVLRGNDFRAIGNPPAKTLSSILTVGANVLNVTLQENTVEPS